MRTLRQIFEEQGENLLLIDTCNGIVFQMMKDNEDFFRLIEYDSIKDLNVDEFKSLEDLENAGYSVLRLDNGRFVTDYL